MSYSTSWWKTIFISTNVTWANVSKAYAPSFCELNVYAKFQSVVPHKFNTFPKNVCQYLLSNQGIWKDFSKKNDIAKRRLTIFSYFASISFDQKKNSSQKFGQLKLMSVYDKIRNYDIQKNLCPNIFVENELEQIHVLSHT